MCHGTSILFVTHYLLFLHTLEFLDKFTNQVKELSMLSPKYIVLENTFDSKTNTNCEYIIGIQTINELFVKVNKNIIYKDYLNSSDNRNYPFIQKPIIHSVDLYLLDKSITMGTKKLPELTMIDKTKLEYEYYRKFQRHFRECFSMYSHRAAKLKLLGIINKGSFESKFGDLRFYQSQLDAIQKMLHEITKQTMIRFLDDKEILSDVFPDKNLLQPNILNSKYYYLRLADELLRVSRIRMYILEPYQTLNLANYEYQINKDELLRNELDISTMKTKDENQPFISLKTNSENKKRSNEKFGNNSSLKRKSKRNVS